MVTGRKPKPHLSVVPDGEAANTQNPSKRKPRASASFEAVAPTEPDWRDTFPVTSGKEAGVNKRAREISRREWRRVLGVLADEGKLLTELDHTVLADMAVCIARIDQLERQMSKDGLTVAGYRGIVKHPAATMLNQYRGQLRFYVAELGLSPVSRVRLPPSDAGGSSDDDELWG